MMNVGSESGRGWKEYLRALGMGTLRKEKTLICL
jgi:hypothetical protein